MRELGVAARKAHPTAVSVIAVLTLASGLAGRIYLALASLTLYKRKTRAYYVMMALVAASAIFYLTVRVNYVKVAISLALLILLAANRRHFTVRSEMPGWRSAAGLGAATLIATIYGTTSVVTALSMGCVAWCLFRPISYRMRTLSGDRARAMEILQQHGRATLDHHKVQDDKSLFFSPTGRSFLAYRVSGAFAVVLGDPVGPATDLPGTLIAFCDLCTQNDWGFALYQTSPDFLPVYRSLGFKTLKLGDDAQVELRTFALAKASKALRNGVRKLDRLGIRAEWREPPLDAATVRQLTRVADEWQRLPGRRERHFALGRFSPEHVHATPALLAIDAQDTVLGFITSAPSYRRGEATLDLMRRRPAAPNGVMDYLIVKLIERNRDAGFETMSLGMVPMNGFSESEHASPEERIIHDSFQRLGFVFSFKGIRTYKAKFATRWEPRYVIYRTELDLPRLAVAFARISESSA
jgi:phosphatidylglycerol lysyltransferase